MKKTKIKYYQIEQYEQQLILEEKSTATVEKYLRDVRAFLKHLGENELTKETVIEYKKQLQASGYAPRSINSMLASINSYLDYIDRPECRVKFMKLQKQVYCAESKELSKGEYERLLRAAGKCKQLRLAMQTICATGIRVSELRYFSVEAVRRGEVIVNCKSKTRTILIPGELRKLLLEYAQKQKIGTGAIFVNGRGKPLDRKTIWAKMKGLCKAAGVNPSKVFPHNLRKLFARTFYKIEKDISKLADILGHSSVDTTRIYIMSTGIEHRRKIESLGLVLRT